MKHSKGVVRKKKGTGLKIFLLLFFIIGISALVVAYKFIHPIYVDTKEKVFQITSEMDEGTFRRDGNTYVYDKDGAKIGKIGNENYSYVKSSDISTYIKNGYIAQEDKNFAVHHGVDYKALVRAGVSYIKNRGVITQGGSTITQQVIKNNLLSSERTFTRKFTEALAAFELEKIYTKSQIMEFYCNSNYYGNGCYGVEGAARYYFGKSAKEVTLAEAAMIVGTSNRPNDYNPADSYKNATRKKEEVLKNMLSEGYIMQEEYNLAIKENPEVVAQPDDTDNDNYMVSYAVHCATLRLMERQGFQFKYGFSSGKEYKKYNKKYSSLYAECAKEIRSGGYKIYTSFDQSIQEKLQKSVTEGLSKELEGAAVCVDNSSQMIVAIVGGKSEKDEFNRAFLSERNPGSSIKPLLDYGPALNEGVATPATVLNDEPIDYNGYSPKNAYSGHLGPITVREALARSVNTVAVKLFQQTGNDVCLSYLEKMKFSSLCYADSTIASISLGGMTYGVKPVDMAKGYSTLANGGKYVDNDCITKLEREDGSIVYQPHGSTKEIYSEDTAYMLTDMLQGVFREEYGTANQLYKKGKILAGKTGTTDDNKDAWFCGYSVDYTTVVWTGCDTPKTIEGLTGSSYPAEIFCSFMDKITDASQDFSIPDTVYLAQYDKGDTTSILNGNDLYTLRPKEYDYYSRLNDEKREAYLLQQRIEKEKQEAEKAVSDFEDFTIKNTAQAKNLENQYAGVLDVIDKIENDTEQAPYLERAAYKYGLLKESVENKWDDVIAAEEEAAKEKEQLSMAEDTAESEDEAAEALQTQKRNIVEWYIDAMYDREVYGTGAQKLVADAENALSQYEGYDDYDDLKKDVDNAVAYVTALPTPEDVQSQENNLQYPNAADYPIP